MNFSYICVENSFKLWLKMKINTEDKCLIMKSNPVHYNLNSLHSEPYLFIIHYTTSIDHV